jgi:hypothetical protein
MADSRREQILKQIVAMLDGDAKPSGLTVNRSRRQAVPLEALPMLSIYKAREEVRRAHEGRRSLVLDRSFHFTVRCRVAGDDEALDPLEQWVVAALASNPSLGGLVLEILEENTEWSGADDSKTDYSVSELTFLARYVTARGDLTKPA